MALRGDLLTLRAHQGGSTAEVAIIAESTDLSISFSAEALETTSQTSGLNSEYIPGKVSCTISGSYLLASGGTQFATLFDHMNSGMAIAFEVYRSATKFLDGTCVITGLELSGGLSDSLVTGSYSLQCSGDLSV